MHVKQYIIACSLEPGQTLVDVVTTGFAKSRRHHINKGWAWFEAKSLGAAVLSKPLLITLETVAKFRIPCSHIKKIRIRNLRFRKIHFRESFRKAPDWDPSVFKKLRIRADTCDRFYVSGVEKLRFRTDLGTCARSLSLTSPKCDTSCILSNGTYSRYGFIVGIPFFFYFDSSGLTAGRTDRRSSAVHSFRSCRGRRALLLGRKNWNTSISNLMEGLATRPKGWTCSSLKDVRV